MHGFESYELWRAFEHEDVWPVGMWASYRKPARVRDYDAVWELREKEQEKRNQERFASWAVRARLQ
jgi:hypothetical protein